MGKKTWRSIGRAFNSVAKVVKKVAPIVLPVIAIAAAPALAASAGAWMAGSSGAVASTVGTWATTTKLGATTASALTGSVLSGAAAAATGQDVQAAMTVGAIGGGVGGFLAGPSAAPATAAPTPATAPASAAPAPTAGLQPQGFSVAPTTAPSAAAGGSQINLGTLYNPVTGANAVTAPGSVAAFTAPTVSSLGNTAMMSPAPTAAAPSTGLPSSLTNVPMQPTTASALANPAMMSPAQAAPSANIGGVGGVNIPVTATAPATAPATVTAPASSGFQVDPNTLYNPVTGANSLVPEQSILGMIGDGVMSAARSMGSAIAAPFEDPRFVADLTLRAAGALAGNALAGDGLTPEQQELLELQRQDLERLRDQDEELFRQRLSMASAFLGEARYFDPEFFGMQAQSDVQIRAGRQRREAERDAALQGGRQGLTASEARRAGLETVAAGQSAYLGGAKAAQNMRMQAYQQSLAALPTDGSTSALNYSTTLQDQLAGFEAQRRGVSQDIAGGFNEIRGDINRAYDRQQAEAERTRQQQQRNTIG